MSDTKNHTPGTRLDRRTGQYVPTIGGIDQAPTSFEESRALEIAYQIALAATVRSHDAADKRCPELEAQRNNLLAALENLCSALERRAAEEIGPGCRRGMGGFEVIQDYHAARAAIKSAKGNQ